MRTASGSLPLHQHLDREGLRREERDGRRERGAEQERVAGDAVLTPGRNRNS